MTWKRITMLLSRAYKMMMSSWHLPIFHFCRSPRANCLASFSNSPIAWTLSSLKYNTLISPLDKESNTLIIRLKTRLQPNTGFTLQPVLTAFTCSGITPPKVNRFGWNPKHSEYILRDWPWQILVAICEVERAREPGEILFFFIR